MARLSMRKTEKRKRKRKHLRKQRTISRERREKRYWNEKALGLR